MKKRGFDYQGAINEGYSPEEINSYLSEKHPNFDIHGALEEGYSPEEVINHLYNPPKSNLKKASRIGAQYAIGAAESTLLPYELAVAPVGSTGHLFQSQLEELGSDMEYLLEKQYFGTNTPEDDARLKEIQAQLHPENRAKLAELAEKTAAETKSFGVRGLVERATGEDLEPEGILENAAHWAGILKDPKKIVNAGLSIKELSKAIAPTAKESLRGLTAGAALDFAEEGDFGPIGTMAAAIVGDLAGAGVGKTIQGVGKIVTKPKETLAKAASKFTSKEKLKLQKEIIEDFRKSGIQADLGTITDSNLVKWTQSRIAQSGLVGKAADEFKDNLINQIRNEYSEIANLLGEARFATSHEAGEVAREGIKTIREADLSATRELYKNASKALKSDSFVSSKRLVEAVERIEKELKPGRIKSNEQRAVLDAVGKLKTDIMDSSGSMIYAKVKDLMNNKIALNDIINYEVQGGAKQLLKGIVSELDRAIISHGKKNPGFARNYIQANRRFSEHAKTFRNKNIDQLLKSADPAQIMNKMNTVQGIRDFGKVLSRTPEGKQIFDNLKRLKIDQIVGDTLGDGVSKQARLGSFSNILDKSKNKELLKEILGKEAYQRLDRIKKNSGRLAESINKYYNASKSGVVAADAAVLAKGMGDVASVLMGNPWPLARTVGSVLGMRQISKLISDPEFLKLTEEIILAGDRNLNELNESFLRIAPYILQALSVSETP